MIGHLRWLVVQYRKTRQNEFGFDQFHNVTTMFGRQRLEGETKQQFRGETKQHEYLEKKANETNVAVFLCGSWACGCVREWVHAWTIGPTAHVQNTMNFERPDPAMGATTLFKFYQVYCIKFDQF
jgi:hypothetical protein